MPTAVHPLVGLPTFVEAWPSASPETEGPAAINDQRADGGTFRPIDDAPRPWSLVMSLQHAPADVAAVGLVASGDPGEDEPLIESITVFTYLGNVPLERSNYGDFIEGSVRLGVARVDRPRQLVIFELPEVRSSHYIWLRIAGEGGEERVGIDELVLYNPQQLEQVRRFVGTWDARLVRLSDVDTSAYSDVDLVGLPELDARPESQYERLDEIVPTLDPSEEDTH